MLFTLKKPESVSNFSDNTHHIKKWNEFGELKYKVYEYVDRYTKEIKENQILRLYEDSPGSVIHCPDLVVWCELESQWAYTTDVVSGYYLDDRGKVQTGNFIKKFGKTVAISDNFLNRNRIEEDGFYYKKVSYAYDVDTALKLNYWPSPYSDIWVKADKFNDLELKKSVNNTFPFEDTNFSGSYQADDNNPTCNDIKEIYKTSTIKAGKKARLISRLLGNLSYGIEYEVGQGSLHSGFLGKSGLVPLIDGSLSSRNLFEYTSVPMQGRKGIQTVIHQCVLLHKACKVDKNCALHVHIGSFTRSKEVIVAMYRLFLSLQEELFNLMPAYKKDEPGIMGKNKNYSAPLIPLDFTPIVPEDSLKEIKNKTIWMYDTLAKFIAADVYELGAAYNEKLRISGSQVPPWNRQWNCPTRYFALNFVNTFFSKSGTLEFRLHEPTLNKYHVIYWLLTCGAIVKYAERNFNKILMEGFSVSLEEVITDMFNNVKSKHSFYKTLKKDLLEYWIERRLKFKKDHRRAYSNSFSQGGSVANQLKVLGISHISSNNNPIKERKTKL
jgi:hypothetical protein